MGLRGEKRLEYPRLGGLVHTAAVVGDNDLHAACAIAGVNGLNGNLHNPAGAADGVAGVQHEIHHHLPHHRGIGHDLGQGCRLTVVNNHVVGNGAAHDPHNVGDRLTQIQRLWLRLRASGARQHALHKRGRLEHRSLDVFGGLPRGGGDVVAENQIHAAQHRRQHVVVVVG